ncbi:unnamed protein product [marine sediment metagenome]|uniref:Uncharacterized protein n=1 Tax=marine sediment metagenome TaxID=412755 RepID=X1RCA4_9ZZZZ
MEIGAADIVGGDAHGVIQIVKIGGIAGRDLVDDRHYLAACKK